MVILKSGTTSDVEVHMQLETGKPVYKIVDKSDPDNYSVVNDLNIVDAACFLHDLRCTKVKIPANFILDLMRAALGSKNEA
jgi:hypothetical protein